MRRDKQRGFTLIELLVVMAIIGILTAIAIPQMVKTPIRAKEAALREDLFTFRSCIDQYFADKGHYPESLEALKTDGYIRKVPVDPITKSAETWELVRAEPDSPETAGGQQQQQQQPGIIDVKSGSKDSSLDGTPYNTW
jgi:general secretion pathway protein G